MENTKIFTPVKVGPYLLTNRMAMAPMTRSRSGEGGVPNVSNRLYYQQRASAGLLISEATQVSWQGQGYLNTPGIFNRAQVSGWQSVVQAVHESDSKIFLQLFHCGRISHPTTQKSGKLPVAPSAIRARGSIHTVEDTKEMIVPKALWKNEIHDIIGQFCRAAKYAMEVGFDGIEIHAANGYLIDQFLKTGTNHRTDKYGGSIANRSAFLFELIENVNKFIDLNKVGIRLSPIASFNDMWDPDPKALFEYVISRLNDYGLAYLHLIEALPPTDDTTVFPTGVSSHLRQFYDGIIIGNGGYNLASAERDIRQGTVDLVSFGKLFIANPDLPARFKAGAPLNEADPATFYSGNEAGYTDYPFLKEGLIENQKTNWR